MSTGSDRQAMNSLWKRALGALGFAFLLAAGPTSAQDTADVQRPADTEFFDSVDVDVVNVDVYVTDKKGQPIRGLTREDFRLFEDGEEQEITNLFAAQDRVAGRDEVASAAPSASTPASESAPPALSPAQQLHLVIFVDHQNLRAGSRNRVLKALRDDLFSSLRAEDRVTLVGFDGSVDVETVPTADPEQIAAGLDRLMRKAPTGQLASQDKASLLRDLSRAVDADELAIYRGGILSYAQQEFDQLRSTVGAVSQFVSILSGLEGRKALVYVSDGLSLNPGEILFRAYERRTRSLGGTQINVNSEARQFSAAPLFEALGEQANAGRVTFYTILAGGQRSSLMTPAEVPARVDMGDTRDLGRTMDPGLETLEVANRQGSLEILAQSTGGRSTSSVFAFDNAIEDLRQDLRSYYSLGYSAGDPDDQDDRELRVEVSNPDWRVRHRESFRLRSLDERMESVTRTALTLQSGANPLGVEVQVGLPEQAHRKQWTVPILVKFPLALLTLLPGEDSHRGRASIYVATQDADGDQSAVQKVPAPIEIPKDKLELAREQVAGYRLALAMGKGEHLVAVTVRDELADVNSSYLLLFDPSAPPPAGP